MGLTKKERLAFLILAFIFVLVEARGIVHIAPGDENVYYYMSKSVANGQVPYRDFFYAHPPLQVLIFALIIKIFGINFAVFKSATLLSYLIASFFLYKSSIEMFKNRLNEKFAGIMAILAVALFLFSFEVMFKATFSLGIDFALMFLMIGFYLVLAEKYFASGLFFGLAGLTRFYALPPIFAILLFVFIKKFREQSMKDFIRMLAGFLLTFGLAIIFLAAAFGHNFTDPVFAYHLSKMKLPNQRHNVYMNVLTEDWMIILAFLSSLFIKNKKKLRIFYFITIANLLFLFSLNVPAEFYFSIAFPFMAVVGAYSIVEIITSIKSAKYMKCFIIAVLISVFLWNSISDVMFLEKYGFLEFSPLSKLVNKVSSADSDKKLFGDDSTVPLVALLANRGIALNYIDSNEMRFTSGLTNFYIFKYQLDDANLSYIILRENKGLHQILQFRQYAESRCRLDEKYSDIAEGIFLVYKC